MEAGKKQQQLLIAAIAYDSARADFALASKLAVAACHEQERAGARMRDAKIKLLELAENINDD